MPGVFLLAPGPVFIDPNQQTVHNNATVTASGSAIVTGYGVREIVLVVNVKAAPTGTSPTITYTIQEIDPGDGTTAVGSSTTGTAITSATTQTLVLPLTTTGAVKVSWVVTGSSPSFTQVYATVVSKISTVASGLDSTGTERAMLVDSQGRTVTVDTAGQQAASGYNLITDPVSGSQTSNYTNSVGPANATLSNTTAGYTTLGGLYQFVAPAGGETDYALFAYQVPNGHQLFVQTVTVEAFVAGVKSSTQPTVLQWALATNSDAVSLATGAPHPPIRFPIGSQNAAKSASLGDTFAPGIVYAPGTPLSILANRYFHVILRIPVGNATPGQLIRGSVTVGGYFE